jgi:hypothetical protein
VNDRFDEPEGLGDGGANNVEFERAVREITSRASVNAVGEVGVGLSVLVDGSVRSIGATTAAASALDSGQVADGVGPCLHALSLGEAVAVTDYASDSRWPGTSHRAATAGVRSSLSLPLKTNDEVVLGALNVYSKAPDAFTTTTGSSLGAFAAQATTSLLLLTALQEQRDGSEYVTAFSSTVERSLRPQLPTVAGLELAGRSVPSSARASVSGDWYDALVLPDGSLALVIGDVMGHGIEAVTAMSQLRTMIRAGAWLGHPPHKILAMADELADLSGITETATLFVGKLTRTGGSARLRYSNAGHLQPLLRHADGTVHALTEGNRILLGTRGTGASVRESAEAAAEIPAGSTLLLYTDGLVERSDIGLDDATEALKATLASFDASTAALTTLCDHLLGVSAGRDDATVFTIRVQ